MADRSINVLAFGRELARFEGHLEYVRSHADERWEPAAEICAAFLALLRALSDGSEPVAAIAEAIRVHDEHVHKSALVRERHFARSREESERRMAEEEVSRKVECPFCGAAAGSSCRTTGAASSARSSHRDRFRLARSLNDGAREATSEADLAPKP
ncbi:hypothetical protein ABT063_24680 [Streptomyces sp. NPDC002838]|uniref:zinc finger domain-containing protein n=1 Tax=Streptomyces sp. NPDC002838 TaxID=3154436 RepID=UPI00331AB0F0